MLRTILIALVAMRSGLCIAAALTLVPPTASRYGYGVHEPVGFNRSASKRPLTLFLHGNGSCGDFSQASTLLGYNGIGKLLQRYDAGNRSAAPVLAAEQFLVVLPLSPLTPLDTSFQRYWNATAISNVLIDVASRYPFDARRITISGYSMGGRGVMACALNHTSPWAGVASIAGELDSVQLKKTANTGNVIKAKLPIRHFHGTLDTTSTAAAFAATTKAFKDAATRLGKTSQLISTTVKGLDHSGMQDQPFDSNLLNWLLTQKRATTPVLAKSSKSRRSVSHHDRRSPSHRQPL